MGKREKLNCNAGATGVLAHPWGALELERPLRVVLNCGKESGLCVAPTGQSVHVDCP